MITCCPNCGVAEYDTETNVCGYCEAVAAQGSADTPSSIVDVNAEKAIAMVAAAESIEALNMLAEAEKANPKSEGGRSGVMKAIEKATAKLTTATAQ